MATTDTPEDIDAEIKLMATIASHLDGFGPQNRQKVAEMLGDIAAPLAAANEEQVGRAVAWAIARAKADAVKAAKAHGTAAADAEPAADAKTKA